MLEPERQDISQEDPYYRHDELVGELDNAYPAWKAVQERVDHQRSRDAGGRGANIPRILHARVPPS